MKKCELCKFPARAYCESDQASLCWDCDAKVHGANFLVARHSRTLLCHACQSQTPWNASGAKLGHTVSVCDGCTNGVNGRDHAEEEEESEADNDDDGGDDDDEIYSDDDDEEEEEEEEEEDGENQVVPWSCTTPPPPASSCSSEESQTSLKRMPDNDSDLHYQDDLYCSCSRRKNRADGDATSVDSFRPLKNRRTEPDRPVQVEVQAGSKSAAIIKRFQHQRDKGKKLSEGSEAVDVVVVVNSSASPSR